MFGNLIPWRKKSEPLAAWKSDDHPMARLRQEMDELWNRFWNDWHDFGLSRLGEVRGGLARTELDDREKEYVVRAELPGFEPGDFDVKVSGNVLTLRAERQEGSKVSNGGYQRYGRFEETFTLPQGVQVDQIQARYHSGVLELHLPKNPECQARRIPVQAS